MTETAPSQLSPSASDELLPGEGALRAMLVLLAAGQDNATTLLRQLDAADMAMLSGHSGRIGDIDMTAVDAAAALFRASFDATPSFAGSSDDFKSFLQEASRGRALPAAVVDASAPVFERVGALDPARLQAFVEPLHPQVMAYVVSRLDPARAADVLSRLLSAQRKDIALRLLTIGPVDADLIVVVERCIDATVLALPQGSSKSKTVAGLLNRLDGSVLDEVLRHIDERAPDSGKDIRKHVFRFEDLGSLSAPQRTLVVDQTPAEILIQALQNVDETLRIAVLAVLAPRVRRMVEAELQSGATVNARDVADARRRIGEIVLSLLADGLITPPGTDPQVTL